MVFRVVALSALCACTLVGCGDSSSTPAEVAPVPVEESTYSDPAESATEDVPGYSVSHSDVYEEAQFLCSSKEPRAVARDFGMNTTDPDQIASRYARGYAAELKQDAYEGCFDGLVGR